MSKRIFLVLAIIASFIALRPSYMWKTGVVDAVDFDDSQVIELARNETKEVDFTPISDSYKGNYTYTRSYGSRAVQATSGFGYGNVLPNSISVLGRNIAVYGVGSTTVDAGDHVNRYGDRFYYGHNSGAVFGGLPGVGVGSTFTITTDGVSRTYRVARTVVYEKNPSSGRLQLNGEGNYMRSVANAKYDGAQYDVSLMTCYGTSYGNGDASHRFVIFANAI